RRWSSPPARLREPGKACGARHRSRRPPGPGSRMPFSSRNPAPRAAPFFKVASAAAPGSPCLLTGELALARRGSLHLGDLFLFVLVAFLVLAVLLVEQRGFRGDGGRLVVRGRHVVAVHLDAGGELPAQGRQGGEQLFQPADDG